MVEPKEDPGTPKMKTRCKLQVCFVLDGTGSMDLWIEGVKKSLDKILASLDNNYVSVAAVIYRDFTPKFEEDIPDIPDLKDYKEIEAQPFVHSSSISKVKDFLDKVKCEHGWDRCENMKGGIEEALKLKWDEDMVKFMIVVTDSPTHGKLFNCGKLDDYPEEDITPALKKLKEKGIELFALQINKDTEPMYQKFKEILENNFELCDLVFAKEGAKETGKLNAAETEQSLQNTIDRITRVVSGTIKKRLKK